MDHRTVRKLSDATSSADPARVLFILSRLFLGGIFVYASFDKILRPVAFAEIVYNYQILPDLLINVAVLSLPWIELMVGLSLIVGVCLPGSLLISFLMLLTFFGSLVFNTVRGLDIDCGCFTASIGPSAGGYMVWYLLRDGFFLLLSAFLLFFFLKTPRGSRRGRPWQDIFGQTVALALSAGLIGLFVNQVRSDSIPLAGDWSPEGRITLKFGRNILIPFGEAKDKFATGAAVFVDARTPELYREGHIQGAINLPLADFDQLADKTVWDFPEDTLFVTYCDGEDCTLAAEVALKLKKIGFENVRVLHDGLNTWKAHRLPFQIGGPPA